MGEGVIMMYRVFLVSFIALVILGMSSVFYAHYIDVRDVEASIMARNIVNCLAETGGLDINLIKEVDLIEYCGYGSFGELFYVSVIIKDLSGGEILTLSSGDSGALFVQQIYSNADFSSEDAAKYRPGYFSGEYPILLKDGGQGEIDLEVIVNDEE